MGSVVQLSATVVSSAALGFLYGTHFDWRGRIDWVAWGTLGSVAVVIVAVVPIFSEQQRRRRQTRAARDHVSALLIQIESLLGLKVTVPILGAISPTEAAPIHELFALIRQLGLLDEPESRHVIVAAGKARMLVLLAADPMPNQQGQDFQSANTKVTRAREVVDARIRPSEREA